MIIFGIPTVIFSFFFSFFLNDKQWPIASLHIRPPTKTSRSLIKGTNLPSAFSISSYLFNLILKLGPNTSTIGWRRISMIVEKIQYFCITYTYYYNILIQWFITFISSVVISTLLFQQQVYESPDEDIITWLKSKSLVSKISIQWWSVTKFWLKSPRTVLNRKIYSRSFCRNMWIISVKHWKLIGRCPYM